MKGARLAALVMCVCISLLASRAFAGPRTAGDNSLGLAYGWTATDGDFDERVTFVGGQFEGWATDQISVGIRVDTERDELSEIGGALFATYNWRALYVPIELGYLSRLESLTMGGGLGLRFNAGESLELKFEATAAKVEDEPSELDLDLVYRFGAALSYYF
jgi:hypothetical protein